MTNSLESEAVATFDEAPPQHAAVVVPAGENVVMPVGQDDDFQVLMPAKDEEVAATPLYGYSSPLLEFANSYDTYARREYGDATYEEMEANDTEVSKCFNLLCTSVVSDCYSLTPAVTLLDAPEYEDAKNIRDFIARSLHNAAKHGTPFMRFAEQMLHAIKYGHKIAEQTWEFGVGEDKDRLLVKTLKVKPQKTIATMVDAFMNIVGYKPLYKKEDVVNANGADGAVNTSPDKSALGSAVVNSPTDKIYSPEKFIHFTLRQADEDPRGHSSFRSAVMSYKAKKRTAPEFIRYILQCAIPGLVFIAPEGDDTSNPQYQYNRDGSMKKDAAGRPVRVSRVQRIATEGQKFRNASVMVLDHGGDVKQVEMKGEGGAFRVAREMFNEDIEQSILFNILATSQGKNQSRSASQTHMVVQDIVIAYLREALIETITEQCFRGLIEKNFGTQFLHLTPVLSFGDTERRNFAIDGKTVSSLVMSKFFHSSQFPALDQMLGAPARDPEMWAAYVRKQEEIAQANLDNAKKGVGNGGKGGQPVKPAKNAAPNTSPKKNNARSRRGRVFA